MIRRAISTRSEQNSQDESTDRPARGIPGAVANQAPLAADLQVAAPETGEPAEFKQRSSSNVKNYEVSKKLSTTVGQIGKIKKVKTAVLVKNKMVETPEGTVSQPISDEDKEKITSLVKEAVGFNEDREDSIVVTSGDFIQEMDVISKKWYERILVPKYDWTNINCSYSSNCNFRSFKTSIKPNFSAISRSSGCTWWSFRS